MIRVTVTNRASERWGYTGDVTLADWQQEAFWTPVRFGPHWGLVARFSLVRA